MRISDWSSDVCSSDLSNHVIEHVGNADAQRHHLDEIRRVLAPDGVVYFAAPNRWRLVEPHFRLPFLSWLPNPASDRYVRVMGRGSHYDRSDERRVGHEWVSTCKSRGSAYH